MEGAFADLADDREGGGVGADPAALAAVEAVVAAVLAACVLDGFDKRPA
ncbi:MAG: hypothetical protein M3Y09_12365 [Actinomycetota bacterium]|nr:hypothetical protein [Actinomycetota bacterium]